MKRRLYSCIRRVRTLNGQPAEDVRGSLGGKPRPPCRPAPPPTSTGVSICHVVVTVHGRSRFDLWRCSVRSPPDSSRSQRCGAVQSITRRQNVNHQPTSYTNAVGRAGLEPATNGLW